MSPQSLPNLVQFFDGEQWNQLTKEMCRNRLGLSSEQDFPTSLSVVITSPLIDGYTNLVGYREGVTDSATRATDAIGEGMTRHGIAAVYDAGSGIEARARLHAQRQELYVVGGGCTLTNETPRTAAERQTSNLDDISRAIRVAEVEELDWISVRSDDSEYIAAVCEMAHKRNLRVSARSSLIPLQAGAAGVSLLAGAVSLLGRLPGESARESVTRFGFFPPLRVIELINQAVDSECAISSGLLASRRATLIKEGLAVPHLEDLIPILPHTRYLIEMRRAGGYILGRKQLSQYSGLSDPSPSEKIEFLRGWEILMDAVVQFVQKGGTLIPASHGPSLAIVPGASLKEEITLLSHLYGDVTLALKQSTSLAANFFGIPNNSPHVLTSEKSSSDLDLALSLRPFLLEQHVVQRS